MADAFKQFKETEDWRKANDLNVLYDTIDLEAYEASRRLYPQWTGRRDKRSVIYIPSPLPTLPPRMEAPILTLRFQQRHPPLPL